MVLWHFDVLPSEEYWMIAAIQAYSFVAGNRLSFVELRGNVLIAVTIHGANADQGILIVDHWCWKKTMFPLLLLLILKREMLYWWTWTRNMSISSMEQAIKSRLWTRMPLTATATRLQAILQECLSSLCMISLSYQFRLIFFQPNSGYNSRTPSTVISCHRYEASTARILIAFSSPSKWIPSSS